MEQKGGNSFDETTPFHGAPELLSSTDVAALLGCTRQNVSHLYDAGKVTGPPRERGTPILIYAESVAEYQDARERRSGPTSAGTDADPREAARELDLLRATVHDLHQEVLRLRWAVKDEQIKSNEMLLLLGDLNATRQEFDESVTADLEARLARVEAERLQLQADLQKRRVDRGLWTRSMELEGLYKFRKDEQP